MNLNRKIDKAPPKPTGDTKSDVQALAEYLGYLQEQINFILHLIYEKMEGM